ncbi:Receptor protein kinase [Spatholobus suberectus]|nr:Receptor protein kinase [Spatholobus suberectus]
MSLYWSSFLLLLLFFEACHAACVPSSCGSIHNIRYPFLLYDDPKDCGDFRYYLSCANNLTVLYLGSNKYYVKAIDYTNYTIRVVDSNIKENSYSFVPRYSLGAFNFSSKYDSYSHDQTRSYLLNSYWLPIIHTKTYELSKLVTYLSTESSINLSRYVEIGGCMNDSRYWPWQNQKRRLYISIGGNYLRDLRLIEYRVEMIYMTSWPGAFKDHLSTSCSDIRNGLEYGIELSWLEGVCASTEPGFQPLLESNDICSRASRYAEGRFDFMKNSLRGLYELRYGHELLTTSVDGFTITAPYELGLLTARHVLPSYLIFRIVSGISFVVGILITVFRRRHLSTYENIEAFLQDNSLMPIRYSYSEIVSMTGGFKDKLGQGGFGSVYKGKLRSGPYAAIKMLENSNTNGQDFISEVATIGRIHHVNVLRLIGYCVEGSKRALVYEFMPSGSLDKYIFSKEESIPLSHDQIYQISLRVARGIAYLHQGCDMQILHFDIKPYNILLDENFIPKISDFGLAKLYPIDNSVITLTAARGTIGYMAPELFYKNIGAVSFKADVYSFGMLLMEMAHRQKNVNPHAENSSQIFFPTWIYDQFDKGEDIELDDSTEDEKNTVKKMIIIALWCIQLKPCDRPSMKKVVEMLEGELDILEMPPKPLLYPTKEPVEVPRIYSGQTSSDDYTSGESYSDENTANITPELNIQ